MTMLVLQDYLHSLTSGKGVFEALDLLERDIQGSTLNIKLPDHHVASCQGKVNKDVP